MYSTIAQLAQMGGTNSTTLHTNVLLTSLIEYYIKKENPGRTEAEHRAQLAKVLENLAKGSVTYDLTHLADHQNDNVRLLSMCYLLFRHSNGSVG